MNTFDRVKIKKYQEMLNKPEQKVLPDINSIIVDIYNKLNECYGKLQAVMKHKKALSDFNKEGLIEAIDRLNEIKEKIHEIYILYHL
jgi:hypothetical protein